MIKELQKITNFTSRECLNMMYKPVVLSDYSGMGVHPVDVIILDDELILGNEHIPLSCIKEVTYGYYKDLKDRLEEFYTDSLEEMEKYITEKRNSRKESAFSKTPMGYHFPFYMTNKIGCGFVIIETDESKYEICYPTKGNFREDNKE